MTREGVSHGDSGTLPGQPVVIALRPSGIPVARHIADALGSPVDVLVTCRVGIPWRPNIGIGAVTADGPVVFDDVQLSRVYIELDDLPAVIRNERAAAARSTERYRGSLPATDLSGRPVVVVDDGEASAVTVLAGLRSARLQKPSRLVCAVPVCSTQASAALRAEADDVICIRQQAQFRSARLCYRRFTAVSDAEIRHGLVQGRC